MFVSSTYVAKDVVIIYVDGVPLTDVLVDPLVHVV